MKTIKVGSRESKLAVIQGNLVIDAIEQAHPEIRCELITMSSKGDKDHSKALDAYEAADLFTNELDKALLMGDLDICVHSFKDLPLTPNPHLPVVALSPRENPMDALLLADGWEAKTVKRMGTSCKRRQAQFEMIRPEWQGTTIRGSVDSRVSQMKKGEVEGLILAVAGLTRLGLEGEITKIFTLDEMIPSAFQGILAVQGRRGEDYSYLAEYHSVNAQRAAEAEGEFLKNMGDQSYHHGVLAEIHGDTLTITGMVLTPEEKIKRGSLTGKVTEAKKLGRALAQQLRERNVAQWVG